MSSLPEARHSSAAPLPPCEPRLERPTLSLRELQQRTYRAIAEQRTALLAPWLVSDRITADVQLQVYENNARETYHKCLAATYPVVQRLVGAQCFRSLARAYAREFPSRHGDLGKFSAEFSQLLSIYYRDTAFDYLPHVAALEWACAEVETAADAAPFDLRMLQAVAARDYAALAFELHPASRLVSSRYPVLAIWEANQHDEVDPVDLRTAGDHVLVYRRYGTVTLRRLDPATFAFVASLKQGETLGDAQDAARAAVRQFDPGEPLAMLSSFGLLVGLRIGANRPF